MAESEGWDAGVSHGRGFHEVQTSGKMVAVFSHPRATHLSLSRVISLNLANKPLLGKQVGPPSPEFGPAGNPERIARLSHEGKAPDWLPGKGMEWPLGKRKASLIRGLLSFINSERSLALSLLILPLIH